MITHSNFKSNMILQGKEIGIRVFHNMYCTTQANVSSTRPVRLQLTRHLVFIRIKDRLENKMTELGNTLYFDFEDILSKFIPIV